MGDDEVAGNVPAGAIHHQHGAGAAGDGDSSYGATATITPSVALEVASLRSDGFGETAIAGPGLFALNMSGQSAADVPAFVGLRFASVMALGNGMVLKPVHQAAVWDWD